MSGSDFSNVIPQGPLAPQHLDYTENPIDIPNPDRGFYRGRANWIPTIYGETPEVDHRVPAAAGDTLYHGAIIPPDEGDNIIPTSLNGVPGVTAMPAIAFMGFDLCRFSSNAFLTRYPQAETQDPPAEWRKENSGTSRALTEYALDYIRGLLQKVREGSGVAFVKFSYDGNGFNYREGSNERLLWPPEPDYNCDMPGWEGRNWMEFHLSQLKPVLHEYEDIIMCVKTGMLGPWGEQHSSAMAQDASVYKMLFDAYLDAVPASRSLLTHGGAFLAWYNLSYGTNYNFSNIDTLPVPPKGSPESRFGFFNDSYTYGYSKIYWDDYGSLSEGAEMSGSHDDYDRDKLGAWIYKQNNFYQGESGIGNNVYGTFPGAVIEAQKNRISNLNMRFGAYSRWNSFVYTEASITAPVKFPAPGDGIDASFFTGETRTAFFDPVYEGKTGAEYMRDRLGYRLVLRDANASEWTTQKGVLKFEGKIQNVGFGNVINRKKLSVILRNRDSGQTYSAALALDARDWLTAGDSNNRPDNRQAWCDMSFSIDMSAFGDIAKGRYNIYLKINDPKETSANRRCIRFANNGDIWDETLGANLIGSTNIK